MKPMEATVIRRLQEIVGEANVLTAPADLLCYSFDATTQTGQPEAVVLPATAEQVAAVMRLASAHRIPVTPRGAGTGLSGGSLPQGGIALALTRMNRILAIDEANLLAEVEPGVVTGHLQAEVEKRGLFYPPDPASGRVSTMGGNIAENAGGPRCFKYGVTRDYVLGLQVVLPDGTLIETGGRTVKNVTGYDLTRLIVGSEGTLGIVTRATLRLIPRPEAVRTLLAVFPRLDAAARTTAAIVQSGVTPATLEIMDQFTLKVVEDYLHTGLPVEAEAVLLVEVDGFTEAVERQAAIVAGLCQELGASAVRQAQSEAERADLWLARKSISAAVTRMKPVKIGEDIAVPVAQIPEMIRRLQHLRARLGLTMVTYGHAGDGNLHPNIVYDPRDPAEAARVEEALAEIARLALSLGGTLSGEHGIGTLKAPYLEMAVGPDVLALMRRIKAAFDPLNILNPGKMCLDDGP